MNKLFRIQKLLLFLVFVLVLFLIIPKFNFSVADEILPNFVLIYDQPWLYQNRNILDIEYRQELVSDLSAANCRYVVLFIGYWDATDPTNPLILPTMGASSGPQNYVRTPAFYREFIAQLHQVGIQVFCWMEGGVGLMDISPANRPNIFSKILEAVNIGFDGFTDDIENWVGRSDGSTTTLRQADYDDQVDYLNTLTAFLNDNGKLHAPAVEHDWEQYINQRLQVDFILSMFYSYTTTFADPQCDAFWQENLGIYQGNNEPPASPLIVGLLIHKTNNPEPYKTIAGTLTRVDSLLATYPHPMLHGFFIWIFEYMNDEDWATWNTWVKTLPEKGIPPAASPILSPSPAASPILSPSPTPIPTATPSTAPTLTPTPTKSPQSPSPSLLPSDVELPTIIYVAIGIIIAIPITFALMLLRKWK